MAAESEPGLLAAPWRPPWPLPIGVAGGWPARPCWKTSSSRQSSWAGAHCSSCSSRRAFTPTCVLSQVRRAPRARGGSWSGVFGTRQDGGGDISSNTTSLRRAFLLAKSPFDPHPALLGTYHCSRFVDEETEAQTNLLTCPRPHLGTVIDLEPLSPGCSSYHLAALLCVCSRSAWHITCLAVNMSLAPSVERGTPDSVAGV